MRVNKSSMTQPVYGSVPDEDWQNLVAWDEEFCLYNAQDSFAAGYHIPESITSEQPYQSTPPSVAGGIPSLEYTSAPPSIINSSSSFGQVYCTSNSPSFDIATTSPFQTQEDGSYFGSFGAWDETQMHLSRLTESPVLDTRFERIQDSFVSATDSDKSATEAVFNPYVAGSSHYFNDLDIRASQVFSNVGTWADQPQIIEPITEGDETLAESDPISIPRALSQSFDSAGPSHLRVDGLHQPQNRSRAITIPEVSRGAQSYNQVASHSHHLQRASSALSVSPVTHRRPPSAALSRSASQSRRRVSSVSPTSDSFGWVSYHLNCSGRLTPTNTEGLPGRTPRGRKKGLTPEQRTQAALMRIVGACSNCKLRKEKCDPGTPCKSCLEHYKGDLVNHPCRDRLLSDLSGGFLSDRLGWHPTARSLESFLAPHTFNISTAITYTIPLTFGFGPPLYIPVHAVHIDDAQTLVHDHVVYSWPPESTSVSPHTHAVLPAVLTPDAAYNLTEILDAHLSLLVTHHFRGFPLYLSPLKILRDVYVYARTLNSTSPHSHLLHQALKLLVLVHVGGDITLPPPSTNPAVAQLIAATMDLSPDLTPTPCFIRAQFGAAMPGLALSLMKSVLSSLEHLLLDRDCESWPIALAVLTTVLMTIESIQYHAAKLPYHYSSSSSASPPPDADHPPDDSGVRTLLAFYSACFAGCHARLRPDWEGEAPPQIGSAEDRFVESVRAAIRKASGVGYLGQKAQARRQGDEMGWFFDRLAARLLVMKT